MSLVRLLLLFFCSLAFGLDALTVSDDEVLNQLKSHLNGQPELIQRNVRRIGNRTIEVENFIAAEMDPKVAPLIFADIGRYGDWALKDINQRPSGGSYLSLIHALEIDKSTNLLLATFSFDLPLFRTKRQAAFRVSSHQDKNVFTLTAETVDPSGTFSTAAAILKLFPADSPGHSWIYIRGRAQLRSWVLYEALPEKVLNREATERIRIILDNYLQEETTKRASLKPTAK